jgi:hypothetical protein
MRKKMEWREVPPSDSLPDDLEEWKKIVDTFFNHGRCTRITAALLTEEANAALSNCVDKTFLTLQNMIFDEIAGALDDWLDVFKIMHYEEFILKESQSKTRSVIYGT